MYTLLASLFACAVFPVGDVVQGTSQEDRAWSLPVQNISFNINSPQSSTESPSTIIMQAELFNQPVFIGKENPGKSMVG